jgi:hypothetical protein
VIPSRESIEHDVVRGRPSRPDTASERGRTAPCVQIAEGSGKGEGHHDTCDERLVCLGPRGRHHMEARGEWALDIHMICVLVYLTWFLA